jgi:hypothetical protein
VSEETAAAEVNKGGERKVTVSFLRTPQGVTVTIRSLTEIEDFFKQQSGEATSVREFGSYWGRKDIDLRVWLLANDPGIVQVPGMAYSLDKPGMPFTFISPKTQQEVVNLAFLRLVGISEPTGVSFHLKGAFTLPHLQELSQKLVRAVRQFYIDFFQPIHIEVGIVGSVVKL